MGRFNGEMIRAGVLVAAEGLDDPSQGVVVDFSGEAPVGWLLATARRRAIDSFRRRAALDERYAALASRLAEGEASSGAVPARDQSADLPWDPDRVDDDDMLALMFVACHPVVSREARVALTLRTVGGLTSDEIARAFLVPVPTIQARITRAKKTIAAAGVPFEVPPPEQRRERLGGVLSVLYVIFTEGSTATAGDRLLRPDLAYEAIRLARMLAAVLPDEPEVHGLLALCELTAARFPARTGPDGGAVLLYEALGRVAPSPVVELNRAVAVAMAAGPQLARADTEARAELELAARLCRNTRQRAVLRRTAAAA